jgi:hypothetical protein
VVNTAPDYQAALALKAGWKNSSCFTSLVSTRSLVRFNSVQLKQPVWENGRSKSKELQDAAGLTVCIKNYT